MNKAMIAMAVGAAALLGGSAANAASPDVKAKASTETQATDISSRARHHRMHRHHHHYGMHRGHYYRYGGYRPYYNSYGSYQRPYGYYGGGPGISFSFGSGGYRGW
jgi:hypothetical protein